MHSVRMGRNQAIAFQGLVQEWNGIAPDFASTRANALQFRHRQRRIQRYVSPYSMIYLAIISWTMRAFVSGEIAMSKFDVATSFFHACEGLKGSRACHRFLCDDAVFVAQCEAIADIKSVVGYCDWMKANGEGPLVGCRYEINASCYDESSSTALIFATFYATHTGEGGPVPPTGKSTASHYVFAITVDEDEKVSQVVKVWNTNWSMAELGWA